MSRLVSISAGMDSIIPAFNGPRILFHAF